MIWKFVARVQRQNRIAIPSSYVKLAKLKKGDYVQVTIDKMKVG